MSHSLMEILARPWTSERSARWYEPDRIVMDDLSGPVALRDLVDTFGARTRVVHPERYTIVSGIDVETALPDRVKADELLCAFAVDQGMNFVRDGSGCAGGCGIEAGPWNESLVGTTSGPIATVGARGGVCLRLSAADLAGALATGRVWAHRPVVKRVELAGEMNDGVTLHDVALHVRDVAGDRAWVVLTGDIVESVDDAAWLITLLQQCGVLQALRGDRYWLNAFDDVCTIDVSSIGVLVRDGDGKSRSVNAMGDGRVDRVFLGSCQSGSVRDLALAASVLRGNRVAIPTTVAPATVGDFELLSTQRVTEGGETLAEVFSSAGCVVGLPGCSGCVNALGEISPGGGAKNENLTCVSTGVANTSTLAVARVLTVNPLTAARCALTGRLA